MGVDKCVYVGPYLWCKVKKIGLDDGMKCPSCGKNCWEKFCSKCGKAPERATRQDHPRLYDLLGLDEEAVQSFDRVEDLFDPNAEEESGSEVMACCFDNCCLEWDMDYDQQDLNAADIATSMKKFKKNHKESIKLLTNHAAVVATEIKFCVATYYA